jgi:exopolysaccharide biosynthesis polyprenyl glycosylphosphotransferase
MSKPLPDATRTPSRARDGRTAPGGDGRRKGEEARQAGTALDGAFSLRRRQGPWKDALRRRMLAAADLLAVLATGGLLAAFGDVAAGFWLAALAPLWILLAKVKGLYDADHAPVRHQTIDELPRLFEWVTLAGGASALVMAALSNGDLTVRGAILGWTSAMTLTFLLRSAARATWRWTVPRERALVVGSGALADALVRKLELESGHHLELIGRLDPDAKRMRLDRLEQLLRRDRCERVLLTVRDLDEESLAQVLSACRACGVKLSVAPPLRAMLGTAVELSHLAELPLIDFRTWDPSRSTMLFKRLLDLVGASLALALVAPLMLALAIAIRLESRGPALFRQRRAGKDGRPFVMLKFRSMVADAEERLGDVVSPEELKEPIFKLRADPRVTRLGRWLRKTSLDELPQLVNVVRGDMSLVGPRPEELWLIARYQESDRFRLEMRPGVTGPMQVHGRGDLTFEERSAVEREYVENYSLRKDFDILLRTGLAVFTRRGAY